MIVPRTKRLAVVVRFKYSAIDFVVLIGCYICGYNSPMLISELYTSRLEEAFGSKIKHMHV